VIGSAVSPAVLGAASARCAEEGALLSAGHDPVLPLVATGVFHPPRR
jgi:hypothetical protein